jgi:hypothetical protein
MPGRPENGLTLSEDEQYLQRLRAAERRGERNMLLATWIPAIIGLGCAFAIVWEMAELRGRVTGTKDCLDQLQPEINKLRGKP